MRALPVQDAGSSGPDEVRTSAPSIGYKHVLQLYRVWRSIGYQNVL